MEKKNEPKLGRLLCRICGRPMPAFFVGAPETVFYIGDYIKYSNVCSEECKQKYEDQFVVEEYKGNKIYCVNGRYMPYFGCGYYFKTIDGVKERIDNPTKIPVTQGLLTGLSMALKG